MLRTRKTSDEADAISANVLADDVAESQHVGMDKFFSKPIKIRHLTSPLRNGARKRHPEATTSPRPTTAT